MTIGVILNQMGVILIFLLIGFWAKRSGRIDVHGTKTLSWLIVNICGPALIVASVLSAEELPDRMTAIKGIGLVFCLYVFLILLGCVMGRLCLAPKADWNYFKAMSVFGNVGFLGIPLASAIFGNVATIYMTMFALAYNVLFYTYGYSKLRPADGPAQKFSFKLFINPGAIAALLAMVFLFTRIQVPLSISEAFRYSGSAVTFLSIFVIGANLSDVKIKDLLCHRQNILFVVIRQLLVPIAVVLVLKSFVTDPLRIGAIGIGVAVPVGNTNSMVAELNGCDLTALTEVTVLTTFLCVVTMTVVLLFVI